MSEVSGTVFGISLVITLISGILGGMGLYWLIQKSSMNMWDRRERTK